MARPAFTIPETDGVMLLGATGRTGQKHMAMMRAYGTPIVAGVSPNPKTDNVDGVPILPSCVDAARATGATSAIAMVPPLHVLGAIEDAAEAGVRFLVTVTEGMPIADAVRAKAVAADAGMIWVGASTPGVAVPGKLKLGFLPDISLAPGRIGFASKSGTLSYEVGYRLVQNGFGQSAWVGVGGDPVKGTHFADTLPYFDAREDTDALVIVGEVGGEEEEQLAKAIRETGTKLPVYAIIAGQSAREGVSMGHAGALVQGELGTFASKQKALTAAGAQVFTDIASLIDAICQDLQKN